MSAIKNSLQACMFKPIYLVFKHYLVLLNVSFNGTYRLQLFEIRLCIKSQISIIMLCG